MNAVTRPFVSKYSPSLDRLSLQRSAHERNGLWIPSSIHRDGRPASPLTVIEPDGRYVLIAGRRRLEASRHRRGARYGPGGRFRRRRSAPLDSFRGPSPRRTDPVAAVRAHAFKALSAGDKVRPSRPLKLGFRKSFRDNPAATICAARSPPRR
jgi:hypothetical protein